jgi:16S rRNA (adenine1518-N6/adenine1519-N6)-dimethyltransferase
LKVKAKKHLGQHFLTDLPAAQKIVEGLTRHGGYSNVLEIGPGMGVLTQYLVQNTSYTTTVIEVDVESVSYLKKELKALPHENILEGDFLKVDAEQVFQNKKWAVIGNLPYNISSQIFFKILPLHNTVLEMVCMLQKEVAQRLASPPGHKDYGILSVLLQAYYDIDYLFTLGPDAFIPPPKVHSGVIRLRRNQTVSLACDDKNFIMLVKMAFNQRRKTLRNALRALQLPDHELLNQRAERLTVADFVGLTILYEQGKEVETQNQSEE